MNIEDMDEVVRKLSSLDDSIKHVCRRLDAMDEKVAAMDENINNVERKFNKRLLKVENGLDQDERYFKSIDQRIASLENRTALQNSASSSSRDNDAGPSNMSSVNVAYNNNMDETIELREMAPTLRGENPL